MGMDNLFNMIGQERQMDRDADAADTAWRRGQENMRLSNDFTERMANTAHQRAVVDLRSAGLNPLLSATKGLSAPAGSGAMSGVSTQAPAPDFSRSFGPAMQLQRSEIDNVNMDTRKKDAERSYTSQLWNTSRAQEALINEQRFTQEELTKQARHQATILFNSAKGAKIEGDIDDTSWGKWLRTLDRSEKTIRGIGHLKPR